VQSADHERDAHRREEDEPRLPYAEAADVLVTPSRIEIYGENGSIIGTDVFGANPSGPITCRGRNIAYAPQNPFVLEIEDFVGAVRDQRPPCTTLDDGLLNVRIMETARDGVLQLPLG
jgi:predicted dehydrogenase